MKSFAACLCLIPFLCQIIPGQTLITDSERKVVNCNVSGEWNSSLGSHLLLYADGPDVRGVYRTVVESVRGAAGPNREAKVVGVISDDPQPTIAFSVLWDKGSCTSWVGQCFILPGGGQVLKMLWMLRSPAQSSGDNWGSTRVGEDQFVFARGLKSP